MLSYSMSAGNVHIGWLKILAFLYMSTNDHESTAKNCFWGYK